MAERPIDQRSIIICTTRQAEPGYIVWTKSKWILTLGHSLFLLFSFSCWFKWIHIWQRLDTLNETKSFFYDIFKWINKTSMLSAHEICHLARTNVWAGILFVGESQHCLTVIKWYSMCWMWVWIGERTTKTQCFLIVEWLWFDLRDPFQFIFLVFAILRWKRFICLGFFFVYFSIIPRLDLD